MRNNSIHLTSLRATARPSLNAFERLALNFDLHAIGAGRHPTGHVHPAEYTRRSLKHLSVERSRLGLSAPREASAPREPSAPRDEGSAR